MRTQRQLRISSALKVVAKKSPRRFSVKTPDVMAMNAVLSMEPIVCEIAGVQTTMIQDLDIPYAVKQSSFPGIYAWIENMHQTNRLLYIGMSSHVLRRLRQHYWRPSPVAAYISELLKSQFRSCSRYGVDCDCLPRYFVEFVELRTDYSRIFDIESELIKKFNPPLNKFGTVRDESIRWPDSVRN